MTPAPMPAHDPSPPPMTTGVPARQSRRRGRRGRHRADDGGATDAACGNWSADSPSASRNGWCQVRVTRSKSSVPDASE